MRGGEFTVYDSQFTVHKSQRESKRERETGREGKRERQRGTQAQEREGREGELGAREI